MVPTDFIGVATGGTENGTVNGLGSELSAIRLWAAACTLRSSGMSMAPPESTPNVSISRLVTDMASPFHRNGQRVGSGSLKDLLTRSGVDAQRVLVDTPFGAPTFGDRRRSAAVVP